MNKWSEYLNLTSDELKIQGEKSGIIGHRSKIGDNRENVLKDFLSNHLPKRLFFCNGNIFNKDNVISNEIDIIIYNDIAINFVSDLKMSINIESIASAISVKSHLDKKQLNDSLKNLASIPQISPDILSFKGLQGSNSEFFIDRHPTLFVFAYTGLHPTTLLKHINDFYINNDIPQNRYAKAVIVNGQYMITFHKDKKTTTTGYEIQPNTYFLQELDNNFRGYPLAMLLNEISSYVDWLPHMRINFHNYFNSGYNV